MYSKYIDGVGFVLRGRRQERYCWQLFWDARIAASGIVQSQTNIPDSPDQTAFLGSWYDWHRGYRIIRREDGSEERQTLVGEPLSQVDIGHLPRSAEDIRSRLYYSSEEKLLDQQMQAQVEAQLVQNHQVSQQRQEVIPEEDRLFDFDFGSDAEDGSHASSAIGQIAQPRAQASITQHNNFFPQSQSRRPERAPRLESNLSNNGTLATIERALAFPPHLSRPLISSMSLQTVTRFIDVFQRELESFERDLRNLRRQQARLAPLGTREEVEDPNYVSPIANMFTNFRQQHQQRFEARMRQLQGADDAARGPPLHVTTGIATQQDSPDLERWHATSTTRPTRPEGQTVTGTPGTHVLPDWLARTREAVGHRQDVQGLEDEIEDPRFQSQLLQMTVAEAERVAHGRAVHDIEQHLGPSLDDPSDNRPAPIPDDEMMVKMQCLVCLQQVANIALSPCGHCILCEYCQKSCIPAHPADRTQPRDRQRSKCPLCQKRVQKILRIYGGVQVAQQEKLGITGNARQSKAA